MPSDVLVVVDNIPDSKSQELQEHQIYTEKRVGEVATPKQEGSMKLAPNSCTQEDRYEQSQGYKTKGATKSPEEGDLSSGTSMTNLKRMTEMDPGFAHPPKKLSDPPFLPMFITG